MQAQGAEAIEIDDDLEAPDGALDAMPPPQVADLDDLADRREVLEAAGWLDPAVELVAAQIPPAGDGDDEQLDLAAGEPDEPALDALSAGCVAGLVPLGPPAPMTQVRGPDAFGYMRGLDDRQMLRLTEGFKTSVGTKCHIHPGKCTLAVAEWKLPSRTALAGWCLGARPFPVNATPAEKQAIIAEHMSELRVLRDRVVWPGRKRQDLLDEYVAEVSAAAAPPR